jgi:hypothetical protein
MPTLRPNASPHRPKFKLPIERCLLTAGSFIHDFRTPSAPETLQVFRQPASGREHTRADVDTQPGERYLRGKRHQIEAAEKLGGDATRKMTHHSGFCHEARIGFDRRNCPQVSTRNREQLHPR